MRLHHAFITAPLLLATVTSLVACSSSSNADKTSTSASTAGTSSTSADATASTSASTTSSGTNAIVNSWKPSTIDPTKLPIGDTFVSTTEGGVGKLWSCSAGNPNAPGATADGPWINADGTTWDATSKLAVKGSVSWPTAKYSETLTDSTRVLTSNGIPVKNVTGTFPIAADDPAYQYDRNPGTIQADDLTLTLPRNPTVADTPSCVDFATMGMLKNGVAIFNPLDGQGRDGVARELQDVCDGHPARTQYHYHAIPSCLLDAATGSSTVVGFVLDGFPLVVERDAQGNLPSNADLDECHGRTSPILLDGKVVTTYHYSATLEFPYVVGCYKGTPTDG